MYTLPVTNYCKRKAMRKYLNDIYPTNSKAVNMWRAAFSLEFSQ